jgi:hypothetical protein
MDTPSTLSVGEREQAASAIDALIKLAETQMAPGYALTDHRVVKAKSALAQLRANN